MKHSAVLFGPIAAAWLLLSGSTARAEFIPYTAKWSASPYVTLAQNHGTGGVVLLGTTTKQYTTDTAQNAITIYAVSSAEAARPDRVTNAKYTLTVALRDLTSGKSGKINFVGQLSGAFYRNGSTLANRSLSVTTAKLHLGTNNYVVTLGPFVKPDRGRAGYFKATIRVSKNPEPSAFVLGALALTFGGWRWRRYRSKNQ